MYVPTLCPVCGAYWPCPHRKAPVAAEQPQEDSGDPNLDGILHPRAEAVPGYVTIDGILIEDRGDSFPRVEPM